MHYALPHLVFDTAPLFEAPPIRGAGRPRSGSAFLDKKDVTFIVFADIGK